MDFLHKDRLNNLIYDHFFKSLVVCEFSSDELYILELQKLDSLCSEMGVFHCTKVFVKTCTMREYGNSGAGKILKNLTIKSNNKARSTLFCDKRFFFYLIYLTSSQFSCAHFSRQTTAQIAKRIQSTLS